MNRRHSSKEARLLEQVPDSRRLIARIEAAGWPPIEIGGFRLGGSERAWLTRLPNLTVNMLADVEQELRSVEAQRQAESAWLSAYDHRQHVEERNGRSIGRERLRALLAQGAW